MQKHMAQPVHYKGWQLTPLHHKVIDVTGEGPEWSDQGGYWHQAPCFLEANGGQRRVKQGQKDWSGLEPPQQEEVQKRPSMAAPQWLWPQDQEVLCQVCSLMLHPSTHAYTYCVFNFALYMVCCKTSHERAGDVP